MVSVSFRPSSTFFFFFYYPFFLLLASYILLWIWFGLVWFYQQTIHSHIAILPKWGIHKIGKPVFVFTIWYANRRPIHLQTKCNANSTLYISYGWTLPLHCIAVSFPISFCLIFFTVSFPKIRRKRKRKKNVVLD